MAVDDADKTEGTGSEEQDAAAVPKKKKSGSWIKIVVIVVGVLVLVGVIVGASAYLAKSMIGSPESANVTGTNTKTTAKAKAATKPKKPLPPPVYFAFDPAFVVNFEDESAVRFLQITVEIMTRDPQMVESVKTYMPKIRNNLVMLFSSVKYTDIRTVQGKEALRNKTLFEIQSVLKQQTGKPGVEEVYFTGFVVQ